MAKYSMLSILWVVSASLLATRALLHGRAPNGPDVQYVLAADAPPHSASKGHAITPEIDAYVKTLLVESGVHGLSVGVVRLNGTKVETEFRGWGNMTEDGDLVRPETLFSIGSCSKAFLAAAMGILMDDFAQGRNVTALPSGVEVFDWHTKVADLVPGWKLQDEWASSKANVKDILSHVSGLTRHDLSYSADETPESILLKLPHLKPVYELREKWSYNNIMFIVGSRIIAQYSGVPYVSFVKERIFEPLNMTSTSFSGTEAAASGWLSQSWSQTRLIPYWFADSNGFVDGAGGIISSSIDMSKWTAMLLNGGINPYTNATVVPAGVYTEVTTASAVILGGPVQGYGMGWTRASHFGHEIIEHGGGLPGFLSEVTFLPSDGIAVVAFVNTDSPFLVQARAALRIIESLLGLEPSAATQENPPPAPAAAPADDPACANTTALEKFAGTYANAGYGGFTLCAPTSTSHHCAGVLALWDAVLPNGTAGADALFGAWPRFWGSHIQLRRHCDNTFRLAVGTPFPHGHGKDKTPFVQYATAFDVSVECVERDGVVVGCGVMDSEDHGGRRAPRGSVEERADSWFAKVNA